MIKCDHPIPTAHYILANAIGTLDGQYTSGCYARWVRGLLWQVNSTICRLLKTPEGGSCRVPSSQKIKIDETMDGTSLI